MEASSRDRTLVRGRRVVVGEKYIVLLPRYMFHVPQAFGTLDTVADFSHIEDVYWA